MTRPAYQQPGRPSPHQLSGLIVLQVLAPLWTAFWLLLSSVSILAMSACTVGGCDYMLYGWVGIMAALLVNGIWALVNINRPVRLAIFGLALPPVLFVTYCVLFLPL